MKKEVNEEKFFDLEGNPVFIVDKSNPENYSEIRDAIKDVKGNNHTII